MISQKKIKKTTSGVELVRLLAAQGHRIFNIGEARQIAPQIGLEAAYLVEALHHLSQNGWIIPLKRGLYALSSTTPGITPVHEFEIAMELITPAAISHWSAFQHHGLTEQIPHKVFVLTSCRIPRHYKQKPSNEYVVSSTVYQFVQVKPAYFFGIEKVWVKEAKIAVTDLERTLLDGLMMPQYCGDFFEVLHAYKICIAKIDLTRIIEYALRLNSATIKRLGWVLERFGIEPGQLEQLLRAPIKGYRRLNPIGPNKGYYNSRWMILENISERKNK